MNDKNGYHYSNFFKAMPALVWQMLFFYIPLLFVIGSSFFSEHDGSLVFTFGHYKTVFKLVYFTIIGRSFGLALTTALVCLLIGYPLAYYIAVKKRSLKNIFLFLLIVPFWTNFLVLMYAWFFVLDPLGLINSTLLYFNLIDKPLILLNNYFSVILVMAYAYLPFMVMPIFTGLEKIDLTLIEASRDLGASMVQTFIRIIVPLSLPGIRTGLLLVFVPAFGEFVIPMIIGGDKNMYVGSLISHFFFIDRNAYAGSAFTVLAIGALFIVVGIVAWFAQTRKAVSAHDD